MNVCVGFGILCVPYDNTIYYFRLAHSYYRERERYNILFDYDSFVISERGFCLFWIQLPPLPLPLYVIFALCISVMMCSNNVQITVPYFMLVLYTHYVPFATAAVATAFVVAILLMMRISFTVDSHFDIKAFVT